VGPIQSFGRRLQTSAGSSRLNASNACDYGVRFAILGLVALSPWVLLLGDEQSQGIVEITVFAISIVWAGKILWMKASGEQQLSIKDGAGKLFLPLGALLLLFAAQLVPLPPMIVRILSPATYQVYLVSLAGWPLTHPYSGFSGSSALNLPVWRPLSLCTQLTFREVLRFSCFSALILISAFYSFGKSRREESRFIRQTVLWMMAVCTIMALWGLMLVLVPEAGDAESAGRAHGPFINSDHFANYLAMITPLMLAGALYPSSFVEQSWRILFRIVSGLAFLIASSAIFLSLSRAGWIIWALGSFLLIWLIGFSRNAAQTDGDGEVRVALGRWSRIAIGGVAALLFLACSSYLLGSRGDQLLAERIRETGSNNDTSFTSRAEVWKASLSMLRDFPALGVGLGSWPEIFERYQPPPYNGLYLWTEAHNDYLQFATETGMVGVTIFALFWLPLAVFLARARASLPWRMVPLYTALLSGIVAMLAHELADFSFRITPNAVLFCVLVGVALRISRGSELAKLESAPPSWKLATLGAGAAVVMIVCAMTPSALADSYDVYYDLLSNESRASIRPSAEAVPVLARLIAEHPGRADPHLAMIRSLKREKKWTEFDREIDAAMWLQPINPIARDWHVFRLGKSGRIPEALAEITRSVYLAPDLGSHVSLLDKDRLLRLTDPEKAAVEMGIKEAVDHGNRGAIDQLSQFQIEQGYLDKAAENYNSAAIRESEPELKSQYFLNAGRIYVQAGKLDSAEQAFRNVLSNDPQNQAACQDLIDLLVREKKTAAVNRLLDEAAQNGVEASPLWSTYAQAAESAGDPSTAEQAARVALQNRPSDLATMRLLGSLYFQHGKFAQAAAIFEDVTEIDPDSAQDFYMLGISQESDFQYDAADSAFRKALSLRPNETGFGSHYREFQAKLKQSSADTVGP